MTLPQVFYPYINHDQLFDPYAIALRLGLWSLIAIKMPVCNPYSEAEVVEQYQGVLLGPPEGHQDAQE